MYDIVIWLGIDIPKAEGGTESLCSLIGHHRMPIRPMQDERLTFMQGRDVRYHFDLVTKLGMRKNEHCVSVIVEDVSHHATPGSEGAVWGTALRCEPLIAATREDGAALCATLQMLGFEIDPYAINRLPNRSAPRCLSDVSRYKHLLQSR